MAFPQEPTITPTARGAVGIQFHIPDPLAPSDLQYGRLGVQIYYSDGSRKEKRFDLLARLQDDTEGLDHLANLSALKAYILARIESELLP